MSIVVQINGINQTIPTQGDQGWGNYTTTTLIALAQSVFPKNGGNFFLGGAVNFGQLYGLISLYFTSASVNPATSGVVRLANTDTVSWRSFDNTANISLSVDTTNNLNWPTQINANEFNSASDKTIKKNITNITSPLEKIHELNGVTFQWHDDSKSVGLIAQDVEKIFPELIKDNNGIKHLNYLGIIGLLVEAVKELHLEVELLKNGFESIKE